MFLFIDTETTGFSKNGYLIQPDQARVCQIAMLMADKDGRSLSEVSLIISPHNGWTVGEEAAKIHGFDDEACEKYGVSSAGAYSLYSKLSSKCDFTIAHNVAFDRKMMEIEAAYHGKDHVNNNWICTMLASMDICKLPGNFGNYKWPSLEEAHNHLCGEGVGEYAHDALYDARACKNIFFAMLKNGQINLNDYKTL